MKRLLEFLAGVLSLALVLYVSTFLYWWLAAKGSSLVSNGKQIRIIEVHQNRLMYHTQPIWEPAFWFMEHIFGYTYGGFSAAEENSAFIYGR